MFLFSIPTLLYHQIEFGFKLKKKEEKIPFTKMREAISHKKTLVAMLALAMEELIVKAEFPSRSLWLGQQGPLLCASKS